MHSAPAAARVAPQRQIQQRAATPQRQSPRIADRPARVPDRATLRAVEKSNQSAAQRAAARGTATTSPAARQAATAAVAARQAAAPQTRAQIRQEQRALRALPPRERAARREELRQQRLTNQGTNARTNNFATTSARVRSGARLNGQPRVTQQAARQGRFAGRFTNANANFANGRGNRFAARDAWRHNQRAGFVPWYGPVFWPYAYSDIFDYAFWPGGYDDGFWDYAYDGFFDGVFFGEAGPAEAYDNSVPSSAQPAPASYASVQALCKQPGSGVTAWPVAEIGSKVGLNDDQKQLLDDVKNAGDKAASEFTATCPSEAAFPLTPPGRLAAMTARLDATLGAVETVKPALEKFYASLSDEQKERFNEIGPQNGKVAAAETTGAGSNSGDSCKQAKPGLTNLPMERVEDAVKPTEAQQSELKNLEDATSQAVSIMQAACPDETPLTPPGRLETMEKRLQAMSEAAKTVKPALGSFYASLSAEQKARFNRINSTLAQGD
jgi:hypothetical protein